MGNCGSNPKTNEGPEPVQVPEPVTEEVKVEQGKENVETKTEETPNEDNKSLGTLLNENVEEPKKTEEVKVEAVEVKAETKEEVAKTDEVKVQEEKPKTEEAKTEA
ncbi:EKN protein [Sesbania bispinosa]|nr:EKN protein [Sesbania bispinosa]